jgi:hypothetical protein
MSLNPSNLIAARENPGRTMFANLARRVPENAIETAVVHDFVDGAVLAELRDAGIKATGMESLRRDREVPTKYLGEHCRWGFRRNWYYWVATGPGVPADKAEEFHQEWGTQCRVEGHCGCPAPLESNRGFAVGLYHIDTQEGLAAFAKLLSSIYLGEESKP